jgi:hypothetical protein
VPQLKPPLNAIKARFNFLMVVNQSVSLALDCSQVSQRETDCASIRVGHLRAY